MGWESSFANGGEIEDLPVKCENITTTIRDNR